MAKPIFSGPELDLSSMEQVQLFDEDDFQLVKDSPQRDAIVIETGAVAEDEEDDPEMYQSVDSHQTDSSEVKKSMEIGIQVDTLPMQVSEEALLNSKQVREVLTRLCLHEGLQLEESWFNYFANITLSGRYITESYIWTWLQAIKTERSTSSVVDLKEMVGQLKIQVSKLTSQVKNLTSHNVALESTDKQLFELLNTIRELIIEKQDVKKTPVNPIIPTQSDEKPKDPVLPSSSKTIMTEDITPDMQKVALDKFLVILDVRPEQQNNTQLRQVIIKLFNYNQIQAANNYGLSRDEKNQIYKMIETEIEKNKQ